MSCRSVLFAGAVALLSCTALGGALAESRVALVIGNASYKAVPVLDNPANDSKAMADLLRSADFEVITARDLGQTEMRRAIGDFARTVQAKGSDTVALVYYAGHGLQVDGDNYLVPVDAQIRQETDVPLETVRLADLMNALAAVPVKTRIVMLDACRNNPFSAVGRSGGRGLAIVDAPNGTIVSYATAPGSEAEDGDGRNSPYTAAFLRVAKEPGLPIEQAFKRVRYAVHQETDGRQTPWESSSLTGDFSFFKGPAETTGVADAATGPTGGAGGPTGGAGGGTAAAGTQVASLGGAPLTRSADGWRSELQPKSAREAYEIVIREDRLEAYQAYLDLFPAESYAPRVRGLLDRRQELVAWHEAATINTPAAYRAFLAEFPTSDYAKTAQRLLERTGRSAGAEARDRACGTPTIRRRTDLAGPTRHALADPGPAGPALVAPVISAPGIVDRPLDRPFLGRPHFGHRPLPPIGGKPHNGKPHDGKPGGDKPVIGRPGKPVIDKPIVGRPVIDKPKPVVRPIVGKPVIGKPVVGKPIMTRPVVGKPVMGPRPMIGRPAGGMGGGMKMGGGGGMRFGGGGFGRFR
ncbi:caspase family protein [Rhodoplanes sp. TEM]|uniref:Caspase family protein n=1 Tax=Rhodoplanes tepidamans TaxID=200616 RepID=A0ABT5JGC8_RHOTP|nr:MULTISPECIES: caspase family protein [Rhodoplanes]MDC7788632.1 caspase family protein [Rhodoplanes tepidamans]MDC7982455.1 caspase family protein [Rhodoplanes sp. TEM]MDQ0354973.1 putative caspase-like protein [Rhodoplanes tepidamans]